MFLFSEVPSLMLTVEVLIYYPTETTEEIVAKTQEVSESPEVFPEISPNETDAANVGDDLNWCLEVFKPSPMYLDENARIQLDEEDFVVERFKELVLNLVFFLHLGQCYNFLLSCFNSFI